MRAGFAILGRTLSKAWQDRILGMSAESAFWQLLSLPSILIALLGALGYAARWIGPDTVEQIRDWGIDTAGKVLNPRVVDQVVAPVMSQILEENRTDVIGIGTIIALWSGSSATATFVNTITIAYGQRDLRGAVRSRLVALRLYLFTVAAGVVVLPAVVFGPGALDRLFSGNWHAVISAVVHVLYWPVLGVVVFAGISTFYHLATPIRLRWRRAFPGAAVALVLFLILSYGLQGYFSTIANNLRVYSTLAAPILTLMYFYALAFAILLGAEFNAALEERWPRGTRPRPGQWIRDQVLGRRGGDPAGDEPDGGEPDGGEPEGGEPVDPAPTGRGEPADDRKPTRRSATGAQPNGGREPNQEPDEGEPSPERDRSSERAAGAEPEADDERTANLPTAPDQPAEGTELAGRRRPANQRRAAGRRRAAS
ncbi:YihY/virulence factor BrkB family protein [Actinocatenispora comari]|uniref:YihY/virulence factor BrkB family protein n=1 Tax=Actinocatenispora comari TaxID=2807577 RepID=UPI001A933DF9|nr:YihY/virulence factor BrkB family protein [Actinocatenispora comari]